jgi:hypothetical protein
VKLQKRLEDQQQPTSYDTPELQEVLPSLDNLEDDNPENDDIENKVLAAARSGADIPTISRNLHLSVDHVSLILKVAATKNRSH